MKKIKIFISAVLACVIIAVCFAFTGCGGDPFDIVNEDNKATQESLLAFHESTAEGYRYDKDTDMPLMISGNSYKMSSTISADLNMGETLPKINVTMTGRGDVKFTKNIAAQMTFTATTTEEGKEPQPATSLEYILINERLYDPSSKVFAEIYPDILGNFSYYFRRTYGDYDSRMDNPPDLDAYMAELERELSKATYYDDLELFISGTTMRLNIGENNYIGVSYSQSGRLEAIDVILKNLELFTPELESYGILLENVNMEMRVRLSNGVEDITAPENSELYAEVAPESLLFVSL